VLHTWVRRGLVLGIGAAAGAFALAGVAAAHITITPDSAAQGSFTGITFRVPTESDTAATTKIDVQLDTAHPIAVVDYQAVPGWATRVKMVTLAKPIVDDDGNKVTSVVGQITWTATSAAAAIKPGQFMQFPVDLGPLPKDVGSIEFKVLQTYSDGTVVRWIQDTPAGGPEPDSPAPVLTLTAAGGGDTSAPPAGAATAPASTSSGSGGGSGATTIAIIAAILGLVGAVLGGAAYARTRGPAPGNQ